MTKLDELIQELCPDGVKYKALGEICKLVTGATPSKTNAAYWENGTIPWMSSGEVNLKRVAATEKKITQLGYEKNSTTIVPKHSVVIALAGQGKTRGKAAITEIELCTNQSLCSMICNENLDYKFLYYILDGKYEELRAISNGDGTRGGLSLKILAPYKIPVPPLPVQREIVRILDNFTELTAELTAELAAELAARKKHYEYYTEQLMNFGDNVKVLTLGEIGSVKMCKRILKSQTNTEGGIPFYKIGTFGKEPDAFISEEVFEEYKEKYSYPKKGDILISCSGTIGRTVVFDGEPAYFQDSNIVWLEHDGTLVTNKYLQYCYKKQPWQISTGGTIARLYNDNILKAQIPVPPIEEQERIVGILDRFDALCNDLTSGLPAEIEARTKQYEYYRDKLLTFESAK